MAKLMRMLQERMRMLAEDAMAVANVVESAFKGADELNDELLDKDLRQVFYDLQDEKILDIRRTTSDASGRHERHYYWRVADVELRGEDAAPTPLTDEEQLYRSLRDREWQRRQPNDPRRN